MLNKADVIIACRHLLAREAQRHESTRDSVPRLLDGELDLDPSMISVVAAMIIGYQMGKLETLDDLVK